MYELSLYLIIKLDSIHCAPHSTIGGYNLRTSDCPPAHTTHLTPPTHPPLIHGIFDITVVMKKFAQNPVMLASHY